jgi:hypothetical protein
VKRAKQEEEVKRAKKKVESSKWVCARGELRIGN